MLSTIRFWLALAAAASVPLVMYLSQREESSDRLRRWREAAADRLPDALGDTARDSLQHAGGAARTAFKAAPKLVARVRGHDDDDAASAIYNRGEQDWRKYPQYMGR